MAEAVAARAITMISRIVVAKHINRIVAPRAMRTYSTAPTDCYLKI
jgi:hypothetical protein